MTRDEHYAEAERLMQFHKSGNVVFEGKILQPQDRNDLLAYAQIHATLALASEHTRETT